MLRVENNDDVEGKNNSGSESSTKSLEIRAFFELVDREAHRLQLLSEKTRNSEKPPTNNFIAWQPSFEMEDFDFPLNKGWNVDCTTITTRAFTSGGMERGCDEEEEKGLKRGFKRPRDLVKLAPLLVSEEMLKKGSSSKVVIFDLNKEAEASEGVNLLGL